MALIFDGVARFSIVAQLQGEECVNVFDVDISTAIGESREEACFGIAGDMLNNWTDHVLPYLSANYSAEEVRWVDLNSADGSTGARSATDDETWPQVGALAANTLPNNTYVKMVKNLEGKTRQQRNGATRLGGIVESYTTGASGNLLDPAFITNINAAFESFKDGINGGSGGTTNLCVLHTVEGVATGKSNIAFFTASSTVGTLRRRMPGYGT